MPPRGIVKPRTTRPQTTLWLLSVGSLHLQQAEPIAGEGGRELHHAGAGGCPDERHDAEVIHVLGNDIPAVHLTVGTELFEFPEIAGTGGLGAVFYLEVHEAAFDRRDDIHFLVFAAFPERGQLMRLSYPAPACSAGISNRPGARCSRR